MRIQIPDACFCRVHIANYLNIFDRIGGVMVVAFLLLLSIKE
jgi:hypothetical protein